MVEWWLKSTVWYHQYQVQGERKIDVFNATSSIQWPLYVKEKAVNMNFWILATISLASSKAPRISISLIRTFKRVTRLKENQKSLWLPIDIDLEKFKFEKKNFDKIEIIRNNSINFSLFTDYFQLTVFYKFSVTTE